MLLVLSFSYPTRRPSDRHAPPRQRAAGAGRAALGIARHVQVQPFQIGCRSTSGRRRGCGADRDRPGRVAVAPLAVRAAARAEAQLRPVRRRPVVRRGLCPGKSAAVPAGRRGRGAARKRTEEGGVWTEGVGTCRSRWWRYKKTYKKDKFMDNTTNLLK